MPNGTKLVACSQESSAHRRSQNQMFFFARYSNAVYLIMHRILFTCCWLSGLITTTRANMIMVKLGTAISFSMWLVLRKMIFLRFLRNLAGPTNPMPTLRFTRIEFDSCVASWAVWLAEIVCNLIMLVVKLHHFLEPIHRNHLGFQWLLAAFNPR